MNATGKKNFCGFFCRRVAVAGSRERNRANQSVLIRAASTFEPSVRCESGV